jgi:hypothetical protein
VVSGEWPVFQSPITRNPFWDIYGLHTIALRDLYEFAAVIARNEVGGKDEVISASERVLNQNLLNHNVLTRNGSGR